MSAVREGTYLVPQIGTLISKADLGMILLSVVQKMRYDCPTMTRRRQWKRLCLGRTSLYRFQRRFLRFPRVVRTSSACHDDSSGNGKSLFVCKKLCFAKLEQGMSKVNAVENIISGLHGPVDAMLSLCGTAEPEDGATASVVYANAIKC